MGLEGTQFEPTDAEIIEASKMANAHDFIESLPEGYNTEVCDQIIGERKMRVCLYHGMSVGFLSGG